MLTLTLRNISDPIYEKLILLYHYTSAEVGKLTAALLLKNPD